MKLKTLDGNKLYEDGVPAGNLVLTEGQRSDKMIIVERFSGSWCDLKPTEDMNESTLKLIESNANKALLVLEGRFQMADTKNANGRIYPDTIWERTLSGNSDAMQRVGRGEMLGELDHPNDGQTMLSRVSCMISEIRRNPSNGKEILGKMVVFNTTEGQKVKAIIEGGGRIGVSSRGQGSVVRTEGVDVVQEDFVLETWDIVHNPSTPGAFPTVVQESTIRENIPMSRLNEYTERLDRLKKRDLQTLSKETVGVILEETTDLKKAIMENKWEPAESVQASGLIADVAIFNESVIKESKSGSKNESGSGKYPDDDMDYEDDDEDRDDKKKKKKSKDKEKTEPRLTTEREVFDYLSEVVILTPSMKLVEAAATARRTIREHFNIEGPMRSYEMAAVSRFVQEAPRREIHEMKSLIVGTVYLKGGQPITESKISGEFELLESSKDSYKVSFTDPSLKAEFVSALGGTGAVIEWDESQRIIAECTSRFESLIDSQARRTVKAEELAEDTREGVSELSLKHSAAKQVMTVLTNRVRVAEDRAKVRGTQLEAAYRLLEALVAETGEERLRGIVSGIAATHPDTRDLAEQLSTASNLQEAVIITKRAERDSLPELIREGVGVNSDANRSDALDLSEITRTKAAAHLLELNAAPRRSPEEMHNTALTEMTNRAVNAYASPRS